MEKPYPIILLPGSMCDHHAYKPQIQIIEKLHDLQVADLTIDSDIEAMAKRTLDNAPAEFIAFGHSMGGITALELLRQAPSRIKALILMATNPYGETEERRLNREALIKEIKETSVEQVVTKRLAPAYFAGNRPDLRSLVVNSAAKLGPVVFERQATALINRIDSSATLKSIKVPTLLICGQYDTLVPYQGQAEMSQKIPNSTIEIIKKSAHFPGLEKPDETNKIIADWLVRLSKIFALKELQE